jgi:hypothetical protein
VKLEVQAVEIQATLGRLALSDPDGLDHILLARPAFPRAFAGMCGEHDRL